MPRVAKQTDRPNKTPIGVAKTQEQWDMWFQHFVETGGNMSRACELGKISRDAVYLRRATDPAFEQRFQEAKERGVDVMEDAAAKRAVEGVPKPVFYMGEECGVIQEYSDGLMQFLLKANRPSKYKERSEVETVDRTPGVVFKGHDLSRLPKEKLQALRELLKEAKVDE